MTTDDPRCDCARKEMLQLGPHVPGCPAAVVYYTKSGKAITNADMEEFVRQAERGYCVEPRPGGAYVTSRGASVVCGKPMPCPLHGGDDA